jgi:SAM-dependent methyltransferase
MPGNPAEELTDDAALGGRLRLLQPRRGHRFGHDAMMLAAATPARSGDRVADLGAGIGAAGPALASRVPGARVTLVEIDARLAELAQENASRNGFVVTPKATKRPRLGRAVREVEPGRASRGSTECRFGCSVEKRPP